MNTVTVVFSTACTLKGEAGHKQGTHWQFVLRGWLVTVCASILFGLTASYCRMLRDLYLELPLPSENAHTFPPSAFVCGYVLSLTSSCFNQVCIYWKSYYFPLYFYSVCMSILLV